MKKTINLLQKRGLYARAEYRFLLFRRFVLGLSVLFLLICLFFTYQYFQTKLQIDALQSKQNQLLRDLQLNSQKEAQLVVLSKKLSQYNKFSKDDAKFIPYYNLLLKTLQSASQSAKLSQFNIDKNRKVSFTLTFASFDELISSFRFIETPSFLNNFLTLTLVKFDGTRAGYEDNKYELSFNGTFNEIQ